MSPQAPAEQALSRSMSLRWRRSIGWRAALAASLALASSAALAFVMPAGSILRHLAEKRDDLSLFTLRVDGLASFHGAAVREAGAALGQPTDRPEILVDATFSLRLPGRCRLDLSPLEGNRSAVVESSGKRRAEGSPIAVAQVLLTPVCTFLASRSSGETGEAKAALERFLAQRKVEPGRTWLGRFGGQVAYVLGEREDTEPQFWVYKDSFLPARLRWRDEQNVDWDVRFYDYTSPASGEWFPRLLEVHRGGELAMRFTSLKADTKATLADKLF
jgi:hypothetical protein